MADFLTKRGRSFLMSRIRSHGNLGTELRFIQILKAAKISGWRRRHRLHGKPDFVFLKSKLAVFVDGCFWHGCSRCYSHNPRSNTAFWKEKITRNKQRDRTVSRKLRSEDWKVLRIWEHELTRKNETKLLGRIQKALKS
ncbi:MAG TPA: very short patch repair endonuclease [Verrucomicrobiae bacterium]|nr:very short patch repair endonuclease [Verrucomicrobiae bacterium]